MEYFAKIIKAERSKNKQFWRYTFLDLDLKTNETDWFFVNYRLNYIRSLPGKLKLAWDKTNKYKVYQDFSQDISNLEGFEGEEWIEYWEEGLDKENQNLEKLLTKRPVKFKHQDYVDFVNRLHHKSGVPWKEIAAAAKRTDRALRYRREKITKPLQKAGRKRMIDRKSFYHLIYSIQKRKTKTLKEMSDYVFQQTSLRTSISTIYLTLKRIRYSYQVIPYRHPQQKSNLVDVIEFIERTNELPPKQLLSTDESGFPLNLALKKGWGLKGQKIADFNKHYATNYSLMLLIRNVENKGIIHAELIEGAVDTDIFIYFLNNIELPADEKYYLLLDRLPVHKTKEVQEVLTNKNIEPCLIVACNPYLNPVEEVFNVIKGYVKKQRPTTEEELNDALSKIIDILQKENLTKYFKDCLDYDFVFKSGK